MQRHQSGIKRQRSIETRLIIKIAGARRF